MTPDTTKAPEAVGLLREGLIAARKMPRGRRWWPELAEDRKAIVRLLNAPDILEVIASALSDTRAQPASQVSEMREKVARIIVGPMCDSTKEEHVIMREGRYAFCTKCGETITKSAMSLFDARNRADAILAILNTSREGGE